MIRLFKYLKPYAAWIAVAIGLLFGQAMCDLALPDYMSRIVNVGIQQGGVEGAAPEAIRAVEFGRLALFMAGADAERVRAAYEPVEPGSARASELARRYPAAAIEAIFLRKAIGREELDSLEGSFVPAWLAVSAIERSMADPASAAAMGSGFDLSAMPPGTDLFALMEAMPAERRAGIAAAIGSRVDAMGSAATAQAASRAVRAEYKALGMDEAALQLRYMLSTGGAMLLLTLLGAVATVLVGFISAKAAAGLARDLRAAIFARVEGFSGREFDKFSTASLITRTTNDVMQIQMVVIMMIRMVFYAPIIGVGGIVKAIGKDSSMWWIIALAVALVSLLIAIAFKLAVPRFKIMQRLIDRLNLVSREGLSGMMVIRAFNMQGREEERFDEANRDLTGNMLFINRVMVVMMPSMMLVMNGISLLIIWIGSKQVAASALQVGDMMAFMQYAMQILFSFLMMSFMFIMLPRAAVSADRVAEVLGTELSIRDPESPLSFGPGFAGSVEFRGVSFKYPGAEEEVLKEVSFTAMPGKTTAIIGPTGSGKSSLVNLLPRFYDVTEGAVLVGGMDVRSVSQAELRAKLGYVPQKAGLFSGSVESNLRFADEGATPEALASAIEIAQARELVESSVEGMGAPVSQGGANLSGGQKQRLSIARALVKRPPIYIFDDCLSALDFKTDSALRKALKRETGDSAVIVVTQRVASIKGADQIVVLDEGRVVGKGTHGELMAACETYREIATSQLSKEELV